MEKRVAIRYGIDNKHALSEREAAWSALLDAYQFYGLDEFDKALLDGIRNGYFDPELVKRGATPLDKTIKAGKSKSILINAWSLYHDSFDNNEGEATKAIFEATFANVAHVSPSDLNGAVVLLKDFGRLEEASPVSRS